MKPEANTDLPDSPDPVWELLARTPRLPQGMAAQDLLERVLAEVRLTPQETISPESVPNVVAFPTPVQRSGVRAVFWGGCAAAAAVALGLFLHFRSDPGVNLAQGDIVPPEVATNLLASDEGSLEQELSAVQAMHALITVEDPRELNDEQLFALLN